MAFFSWGSGLGGILEWVDRIVVLRPFQLGSFFLLLSLSPSFGQGVVEEDEDEDKRWLIAPKDNSPVEHAGRHRGRAVGLQEERVWEDCQGGGEEERESGRTQGPFVFFVDTLIPC